MMQFVHPRLNILHIFDLLLSIVCFPCCVFIFKQQTTSNDIYQLMLFFLIQTQFVVSYTISTIVMTFCFNNDTSILQWNNLFDVNGINIQLLIVSYFSTIFPSNPIYHLYFVSYYFHCCIINILEQYWNIKQSKGSPLAL